MTNKRMKRCSISLAIKKMQIKTTIGIRYLSTQLTKTKRTDNTKYWQGYGAISYTASGSLISTYSLESIWDYLVKIKLCLFYNHVISLLDNRL